MNRLFGIVMVSIAVLYCVVPLGRHCITVEIGLRRVHLSSLQQELDYGRVCA